MIIELSPKPSKFSASHALPCFGPDHPCAFEHGHTWHVSAAFRGRATSGVLVPFDAVSAVVKELDHAALHVDADDLDKIKRLEEAGVRVKPAPSDLGLPSAENILQWLVRSIQGAAALSGFGEHPTPQGWRAGAELVRVELLEDPMPGGTGHVLVWDKLWHVPLPR